LYPNKSKHTAFRSTVSAISFILVLVLLMSSLSGCYFFPKEEEVLAPPIKIPDKITYDTLEVTKGTIENTIRVTGSFVPVSQHDLFYVKGDRLKDIYVITGQEVKKGELLAELETDAVLGEIQMQEIALKRAQILYDDAKARYDIVGGSRTELDMAELDLQTNQLKLEKLKSDLARARLVSPIKQGEYVNPYQTVVRVADPKQLQLRYSGDRVANFRLGMKAVVQLKENQYEAEVVMTPSEMPSDADEQTKNSVQLKVYDLPEDIKYGQTASISLTLERRENVIVIPKLLVNNFANRKFVNILKDGIREERDIEVGITNSTEAEVIKGLEVGELLIVR
jgi:macrolide-specific efflux system membrane fusion protein